MPGSSWDDDESHEDSSLDAFDFLSSASENDDESDDWSVPTTEPASEPEAADDWAGADWSMPSPAEEPAADEPDDPPMLLVSVTNPAGTVTAKAAVSGRIQRIELAPNTVSMSEAALIHEVIATAKLANLKGRAVQYTLVEGILGQQGLDPESAHEFIEQHMDLPTPAQAGAAEMAVRSAYLRGEH